MELQQLVVVPAGLESASDVVSRLAGPAAEQSKRIANQLLRYISERKGVEIDSLGPLPMRLALVLEELATNLVWHDLLGLLGAERQALLEHGRNAPGNLQHKFRTNAKRACGHEARMTMCADETVIRIRVMLRNEFPEFPALWARFKAADYAPTVEELESPTGRGMLLIATYCVEGEYDARSRTLAFAMEH